MRQFPAFFNLDSARIVVFGDGEEAARKLRLLLSSPAELLLVGGFAEAALAAAFEGRVTVVGRSARETALEGARLAIVAEADERHRTAALAAVRARGIPVNVVDFPEDCDFTVPSILDRGEIDALMALLGATKRSVQRSAQATVPE